MNPYPTKKSCSTADAIAPSESRRSLDAASAAEDRKRAMRLDEREWQDRTRGSRAELAETLSRLSQTRISEATLAKWLGPDSRRQMPATLDQAWAAATGSTRIKQVGADALGGRFVGLLDLAKIGLADADLQLTSWRNRRDALRRNLLLEHGEAA